MSAPGEFTEVKSQTQGFNLSEQGMIKICAR